ncbi:hypothetical protein LZC95_39510 [Pendulispora brunnea]|uniref:Delta-60 repeat domain-containing protein n=1 Tax=Pendulispora brunnea TaxID=2905690 RepID=A0ABZ2KNN2_9BACT
MEDLYWHPYMNLFRVNADGTLDTSFAGTGNLKLAMRRLGAGNDSLRYSPSAVTTTPDGKIAVLFSYQPTHYSDPFSYALVRLQLDGTPDPTLGGNGIVFFGQNEYSKLAVQQDGKLIVTGTRDKEAVVARLNVDGSFDTSFGSNGQMHFDAPQLEYGTSGSYTRIADIAVQPDGKVLVAGHLSSATSLYSYDALVARVTVNGRLDASFGENGIVATDIAGGTDEARSIALQKDGRIVVSGSATVQEPGDAGARVRKTVVLRYRRNGSLDMSWNCSGYALYDAGTHADSAIDRSGRILLGGYTSSAPWDLLTVRLRGTRVAHATEITESAESEGDAPNVDVAPTAEAAQGGCATSGMPSNAKDALVPLLLAAGAIIGHRRRRRGMSPC